MQQSVTYQYVQAVKAIKQAIQVSRYRVSHHGRMRQFYEEWVDVFENCSAVRSEMGIVPIFSEIQPFTFCSSVMSEISEQTYSQSPIAQANL